MVYQLALESTYGTYRVIVLGWERLIGYIGYVCGRIIDLHVSGRMIFWWRIEAKEVEERNVDLRAPAVCACGYCV